LIFKKHKSSPTFSLDWHSHTFQPNTPRNSSEAKEIMIRKEVIFQSQSTKAKTILNDLVHTASSYEEAVKIIEEKNKPIPTFSGIYAPNNSGKLAQSFGDDSPNTQSDTTIPNKNDKAHKKTIWYKTTLFKYLVFPILVILICAGIFYLVKHLHWQ
jgi:hypothetical protein